MMKLVLMLAAIGAAAQAEARTAVEFGAAGHYVYDASTATLTVTGAPATAFLAGPNVSVPVTAALTLQFAAPLVETTTLQLDYRFTGSGYRYVTNTVTGTVDSARFSLTDGSGNDVMTFATTPGFSSSFEHFTSYDYYYYNDGHIVPGPRHDLDYFSHFLSTALLAISPGHAENDSTIARMPTTEFVLTSDFPDYVPTYYRQAGAFDTYVNDASSDPDLLAVRGSSSQVLGDFSGSISWRFGPAVPEPSVWAMLVIGFGVTGAAVRRRGRPAAART
jgi:hypothetical protein